MARLSYLALLTAALGLLILGCGKSPESLEAPPQPPTQIPEEICGEAKVVDFIAGQHYLIGTITVANDADWLYVEYKTTDGWVMYETHLHVALSFEEIPQTNKGCPKVGHFRWSEDHDPPVTEYTYVINLAENGWDEYDWLYIAAHAAVRLLDGNGGIIQEETAWGQGEDFPCPNWAMYLTYVVQPCEEPPPGIEPGDFRTYTQGGWGTECHGQNPGCYRDDNFDGCFPDGLTVGCGRYAALFTSSEAIQEFLPAGGTPAQFTEDHTDPTTPPGTEAGVLAGQLVALTLNVEFDVCDEDFGASEINLKDLKVIDEDSPFWGWTVQQVLDEGNDVLGACSEEYTPSEVSDAAAAINENFVDGEVVGTFLGLPTLMK